MAAGLKLGSNVTKYEESTCPIEKVEFKIWRHTRMIGYCLYALGAFSIVFLIWVRGPALWGDIEIKRFQSHFPGAGYFFYLGAIINVGIGALLVDFFLEHRERKFQKVKIWIFTLIQGY